MAAVCLQPPPYWKPRRPWGRGRRGCILWDVGKACATRKLKRLPQQRHIPVQLIRWEYVPWALKCSAFLSLDILRVLEVRQNFIRVVVLRLLSRSENFHSSKHKTDLTFNLKLSMNRTSWPQRTNWFRELLCSAAKQKHSVNRKGVNHNL